MYILFTFYTSPSVNSAWVYSLYFIYMYIPVDQSKIILKLLL